MAASMSKQLAKQPCYKMMSGRARPLSRVLVVIAVAIGLTSLAFTVCFSLTLVLWW